MNNFEHLDMLSSYQYCWRNTFLLQAGKITRSAFLENITVYLVMRFEHLRLLPFHYEQCSNSLDHIADRMGNA